MDAGTLTGRGARSPRQPQRRSVRPVRVGGVTAAIAATALLSSACAAGQQAQTANEKNSIDGANSTIGAIDLRALALEAPVGSPSYLRGSDAEITGVIVNSGQRNDTLTSITSASASGWGVYSQSDGETVQAAASSSAVAAVSPSPADSVSSSASSSAGTPASDSGSIPASDTASVPATESASTPSLPTGSTSVTITAGNRVSYGTPDATKVLLLRDLQKKLYPGTTVRMTFSFQRAGDITVAVPIQLSEQVGTATVREPDGGGE